jgi:hypothetical protein
MSAAEPTPYALATVHFAELPDAAALNLRLAAAFERERTGPAVRRTHMVEGRYENTYIERARLPELTPVADFALRCAARVLGRDALRHGFWFNEMPPGQRTTLHSHEEADELLSAVYYLSCPPHGGRLILYDDNAQILITPRPGLLVMFAPHLPHEVEVNASGQTRLSVAFNFGPRLSAT